MHYTSKYGICRYLRRQCTPVCSLDHPHGDSVRLDGTRWFDFSVRDNPQHHVLVFQALSHRPTLRSLPVQVHGDQVLSL
jgi:hypothetical protein